MATNAWDGHEYDAVSRQRFVVGDLLIRLAGVRPGEDVLDVGCGTGELTIKLAKIVYPGRVLGIDNAPGMIEVALSKAQAAGMLLLVLALLPLVCSFSAASWRKGRSWKGQSILIRHLP
ncbi:MAG: methyltransferase domain-containing protein [Bacillota bacterium]